jgi:hypothetical protein
MNDINRMRTDLANQFALAGAAFLDFIGTGAALAAIPDTSPQQYAAVGTREAILRIWPDEQAGASTPPLTAPAPLTDELRKLVNVHCNDLLDCAAILHDDGRFKRTAEEIRTAVAELRAAMKAAPAPQQSELTDERIEELNREAQDQGIRGIAPSIYLARAIEREVAKAAPAAPVQTAEQSPLHWLPIEQAPTDGTELLLTHWTPENGYGPVDFGSWGFIENSDYDDSPIYGWLSNYGDIEEPTHFINLAAPVQAEQAQAEPVAWMNPETLDVIHNTRKRAWENDFGMGGKAKAAGYTCRLVAPAQAEQVAVRAALDVLAERRRQVEVEGWAAERDDKYINCELARAAATYATCSHIEQLKLCGEQVWPWHPDWWKRSTYRADLVKAGALVLAEIERLDRAAPSTTPSNDTSALGDTGGAK